MVCVRGSATVTHAQAIDRGLDMDVRSALLHSTPHQPIDELDNGRLACHVLQALDIVVTNEDLLTGLVARHARLDPLLGWLVEPLQRS